MVSVELPDAGRVSERGCVRLLFQADGGSRFDSSIPLGMIAKLLSADSPSVPSPSVEERRRDRFAAEEGNQTLCWTDRHATILVQECVKQGDFFHLRSQVGHRGAE